MITRITDWVDERLETKTIASAFLDRHIPKGVGWLYTLGSASLFIFIMQATTGIFLSMNYSPSPDHAYNSIQYINNEVTLGWFVRRLHQWGASGMVVVVAAHMLRVFIMGAYKYPRELTWVVGVLIFMVVMGLGFTGYLLPWDQKAYWATAVGTNVAGSVPYIGTFVLKVLRGGTELGAVTLTRFYAIHMLVLPSLLVGLIGLHLFMVVKQGISAPPEH